jgi:hypothetical protein
MQSPIHLPDSESLNSHSKGLADPSECLITASPHHHPLSKRFPGFQMPFIYSFVIHFILILSFMVAVHKPDTRPVKEVNYWVVNLITDRKLEPKGEKKESRPIPNPAAGKKEVSIAQIPSARKEFSKLPFDQPVSDDFQDKKHLINPEAKRQEGKAVPAMQPAANQNQVGQYSFGIRMGDPMILRKIKLYRTNLEGTFKVLIAEKIPATFSEKVAAVEVSFQDDGSFANIVWTPDSNHELINFLQNKMEWPSLPSPNKFGLPNKAIRLQFHIDPQGTVQVNSAIL